MSNRSMLVFFATGVGAIVGHLDFEWPVLVGQADDAVLHAAQIAYTKVQSSPAQLAVIVWLLAFGFVGAAQAAGRRRATDWVSLVCFVLAMSIMATLTAPGEVAFLGSASASADVQREHLHGVAVSHVAMITAAIVPILYDFFLAGSSTEKAKKH